MGRGQALKNALPTLHLVHCPGCQEKKPLFAMKDGRCGVCRDGLRKRAEDRVVSLEKRRKLEERLDQRALNRELAEVWA